MTDNPRRYAPESLTNRIAQFFDGSRLAQVLLLVAAGCLVGAACIIAFAIAAGFAR